MQGGQVRSSNAGLMSLRQLLARRTWTPAAKWLLAEERSARTQLLLLLLLLLLPLPLPLAQLQGPQTAELQPLLLLLLA